MRSATRDYDAVDSVGAIEQYAEMRGFALGAVSVAWLGAVGAVGCGSIHATTSDAGAQVDASSPSPHPIDAAPDGALTTRFDVGYVNDITFVPLNTTSIHALLLVVNKGTAPLHLATASVLTFNDDSDGVDWSFKALAPSPTVLDPGRAGGALSPSTRQLIVNAGYVTERIDDNVLDFEMDFAGTPATGVVDNAQAVLHIDGVDAVLKFKITTVASGDSPLYNSGARISSQ